MIGKVTATKFRQYMEQHPSADDPDIHMVVLLMHKLQQTLKGCRLFLVIEQRIVYRYCL